MKLKNIFIFKTITVIATMIMLGYTLLLPAGFSSLSFEKTIVIVLGIILSGIVLLEANHDQKLRNKIKIASRYIIVYLVIIIFEILNSLNRYNYDTHSMISVLIPFGSIFFALPIVYIFYKDKTSVNFLWIISAFEFVMILIRSISWFFYNFKSRLIFPRLVFQYGSWQRNGLQRIEPSILFGIIVIFWIYIFLKSNKNLLFLFPSLFMIVYLIFVSQVRFQTIISLLAIVSMIYYFYNKKKNSSFVKVLIIAMILILIISGFLSSIISTFSIGNVEYGDSTTARFDGINHYFEIIREQGAYFRGLGFLNDTNSVVLNLVSRNAWSEYYLDDLGIIGGLIEFGLMSVVLYGYLFYISFKTCYNVYRKKEYQKFSFLFAVMIYMVVSCLILNIFDPQRAFDVPYYLAIFSFYNNGGSEEDIEVE
ncbi:MAG: hypothetical protein ABF695_12495 [Liquorilactobacillus ghanensis]|uniref:hypothetical protein n=1 Tax=Liquorilactobacillus ghanensis TaxID=399370 RepID=UPI0039E8E767